MSQTPSRRRRSLESVRLAAQRIALAPFTFQATKSLRDLGILKRLYDEGPHTVEEMSAAVDVPVYGVTVLLEMGLSAELVRLGEDQRYDITPVGMMLCNDPMTSANFDFSADVCYRGMEHLTASVMERRPAGLVELSDKATVYEALATLPEPARTSWFKFDHYYSDAAFDPALDRVLQAKPAHVVDVGANTGRFARTLLGRDANVRMSLVDHPGQLAEAKKTLEAHGVADRATLHPMDLLDGAAPLPSGADVVWLSQLLDCFSEEEIVSILSRARAALNPGGRVAILELLWDRQASPAATFILHATSLYFTALANGTSRMYSARAFLPLVEAAGLKVVDEIDDLGGLGHTFLWCEARG